MCGVYGVWIYISTCEVDELIDGVVMIALYTMLYVRSESINQENWLDM